MSAVNGIRQWDKYALNEYAQPIGCVRENACMLEDDHKPQCGVTYSGIPTEVGIGGFSHF